MSLLNAYYATLPSVNYIFPNGKSAVFVFGRFLTDIPSEIEHLDNEIKNGHPHIYKKKGEETIDSKYLDPMVAIREKIIAEALATGELVAGNPTRDMGTSHHEPLKPASTHNIAEAAAGGSGVSLVARMASLAAITKQPVPVSPNIPADVSPPLGSQDQKLVEGTK